MRLLAPATLLLLGSTPLLAQDVHVRVSPGQHLVSPANPNAGPVTTFPTIQNALDHYPSPGPGGRVFIEIDPGVYHERLNITRNHPNVTLIGKGARPEDVLITWSLNARQAGGTFFTETVQVNGDGFEAANLSIENAAGNTGQAVAAAVRADRVVFRHVRLLGHQDTLFADYGRQLYDECYIAGGVDFIFGNAQAVFYRSELHSNGPGFVTAQSRTSADQPTGYVIVDSRVTAAFEPREVANGPVAAPLQPADMASNASGTTSLRTPPQQGTSQPGAASLPGAASIAAAQGTVGLGRPWRPYSRVIYIRTSLPAALNPLGWNNWGKVANQDTAFYAEYGDTGPGANPSARVPWSHQLTTAGVQPYLPENFLAGDDHWDALAAASKLP